MDREQINEPDPYVTYKFANESGELIPLELSLMYHGRL